MQERASPRRDAAARRPAPPKLTPLPRSDEVDEEATYEYPIAGAPAPLEGVLIREIISFWGVHFEFESEAYVQVRSELCLRLVVVVVSDALCVVDL